MKQRGEHLQQWIDAAASSSYLIQTYVLPRKGLLSDPLWLSVLELVPGLAWMPELRRRGLSRQPEEAPPNERPE
jgi:hypothetical protein